MLLDILSSIDPQTTYHVQEFESIEEIKLYYSLQLTMQNFNSNSIII